jgi:hypothetical protein
VSSAVVTVGGGRRGNWIFVRYMIIECCLSACEIIGRLWCCDPEM